jgi:hypothetical protein
MTALALQFKHDISQLAIGNRLAATLMADIEILTKQAHQVAMGEKYGPRAMGSDQGLLFAEMGPPAGYPGANAGFADAGFPGQAGNAAPARAKAASG